MQIPLATPHTVGSEPPRPPPPPPPAPPASNTDTQRSSAPSDKHLQDTATRKQQQPLSAISIQDLNSVQVNEKQSACHLAYLLNKIQCRWNNLVTPHR